mgnify:FL=1
MAACPCCGAELTGYERVAVFGDKEKIRTETVLCCPCCRWQGVCRENCPDDLLWG